MNSRLSYFRDGLGKSTCITVLNQPVECHLPKFDRRNQGAKPVVIVFALLFQQIYKPRATRVRAFARLKGHGRLHGVNVGEQFGPDRRLIRYIENRLHLLHTAILLHLIKDIIRCSEVRESGTGL